MDAVPQLSREEYVEAMRQVFEQAMRQVADAINDAPAGQVIAGSEEQVRDLFGEFRRRAYEVGLQMRVDAAEAAFSPSEGPHDRASQTQQGTGRLHGADGQ